LPTIDEAIAEGVGRLHHAGQIDERRSAKLLLAHVLGIDQAQLHSRSKEQLDEGSYQCFLGLVERRAAGEPLQHITGRQEFYGLEFIVTPDVLIPRPETEFLVEQVLRLAGTSLQRNPVIVDIGTGSGCIAVALASRLPGARLIATDISPAALRIARLNAERHGAADRIEFLEGDMFQALRGAGLEGAVDVIAANPPYVPSADPHTVERQVRDYEPAVALFGGEDGLAFYSRLLDGAPDYLRPGGYIVCEIGFSQLDAVQSLIRPNGFDLADITSDLQGIPRTLTIRRLI
jgi:release factor glutamine methyltransferase